MAQIKLEHVSKQYGGKHSEDYAVKDVSYTIPDGHFVSILGPSGCGKSTTLNMIAGLESVTGGAIWIGDQRVEQLEPHQRDLAFVFQDYALYPHLNVYDNIAFGLRMRKMPAAQVDERVHDAAAKLELESQLKKKPRALSGGQRQRVALARAIARRPGVLLFDEPLSNLDALLRDKTRSELKLLHADIKSTSVYVTHDQEEAMSLSDAIAVMSRGHLEQFGTPDQIYREPATEFVATFVGKPRMNMFTMKRDGSQFVLPGTSFRVPASPSTWSEVRVGYRPGECGLSTCSAADSDGSVLMVEPLGSHTDVTVDLGAANFVVRLTGFTALAPGDPVRIDVTDAAQHLFDVATGQRL
ncbi:ABC transporter ATP-binding protein [Tessaracoccus caeni]|uniref:ABC transporter ATP-binding protein n=1 Tax=Tessaracoccus caeni TaxID=3031239 RepID=UPI0023DCBA21|nr:ABC transporter ATP-binding protein [Tessaracoccus caeni]MDF1489269.1 ABC transporter ATP-binding protein [Tessaracoccus caeni]